jgi:Ca2+-binding RTX toxin-like protein
VQVVSHAVTNDTTAANGASTFNAMSEDGHYIVFTSTATNLVNGDDNGRSDIFLYDTQTHDVSLVDVAHGGVTQVTATAQNVWAVTDDGVVVFTSDATDIPDATTATVNNLFAYTLADADQQATFALGNAAVDLHFSLSSIARDSLVTVHWGDGTQDETATATALSTPTYDFAHNYAPGGTYSGTLTVADSVSSAAQTFSVRVANYSTSPQTLTAASGTNFLFGSQGNDTLTGGTGSDTLVGGQGNDFITTGTGSDTIVFRTGDGSDTVSDFTVAGSIHDIIDLTQVAGVHSLANLTLTQSGADTIVDLPGSDQLLLQHVTASTLTNSDFHFA